jgi:peptidoglycan lytic transglycosylase
MYRVGPRIGIFLLVAAVSLAVLFAWRGLMKSNPGAEPNVKASTSGGSEPVKPSAAANQGGQTGRASWYSLTSKTANGDQMEPEELTAAHPSLRFGTKVEVENLDNGRKVTVRVNDRGPFVADRIIDVSKAAAKSLDMIVDGIATVRIRPQPRSTE